MSEVTIEHIHQSNLIEGFDSEELDAASMDAWRYIRAQRLLSHEALKRTHTILTAPQSGILERLKGEYRDQNVQVGETICPPHQYVPELMQKWLATFALKDPKQAHVEFEKVHPFIDGNGRTGRLLMWWQQVNQQQAPTLISSESPDIDEYYSWFKED